MARGVDCSHWRAGLSVVNQGGEVHTFTEVDDFGGGIVPELNALSGTPVVAPECLALGAGDFIAPGGQTSHTFERGEADKYQCCIHPWMRARLDRVGTRTALRS